MADLGTVILYALLPVGGHLIGALLAECVRTSRWVVGIALHGSAGIAIALVSMDFFPRINESVPFWLIMVMFLLGAALSVFTAKYILVIQKRYGGTSFTALMVYGVISIDLITDGLMTGAGTAIETRLGFLLSAAQAVANIPGGFAATATLRNNHVQRRWRMGTALFLILPVVVAAIAGLLLLSDKSPLVQNAVLALIAGLLLLATVEDIIPEGDAPRPPRSLSTAAFALGFVGLAISSHFTS